MEHGGFHARQADLARAGQAGGLFGGAGNLGHGTHQVARGGGDLPRGGADLGGGGGSLRGGGLLLARGGRDFIDGSGHLDGRALGLADQPGKIAGHPVEALLHLQELVLAVQRQALAQVAAAHAGEQPHDTLHWHGDSAQ